MNLSLDMMQRFAMGVINSHPEVVKNNPRGQELVSLIQNGDSTKGMEVAQNLCNGYGNSKDDALGMAQKFFGF